MMKDHRLLPALAAAMMSSAAFAPTASFAATCESLMSAHVASTTITAAQSIPVGNYVAPDGTNVGTMPAFCRVAATVSTQPTEAVKIEIWMPASGWNGKYEAQGSGGFGGAINYSALAAPVNAGFAAATTDTGHEGGAEGAIGAPLPWAQNPVSLFDWGHTSIHLMTVAAKDIIKQFYKTEARFSYYSGCSTGGAEAMEEAEFYPEDFDGLWAGSPGMDYSHLMESFLWGGLPSAQNPAANLPRSALTLLNNAVLNACASSKAVSTDTWLNDPRDCNYDPSPLLCKAGQSPSTCLSAPQVAAAKHLYSLVTNPRTGLKLYPGFARGSEGQWSFIQGILISFFAQPLLANTVFNNPNWDWKTFNYDSDARLVDQVLSPRINATNPDLSKLRQLGHKLIMTQGWIDAFNAQTLPIEYYDNVVLSNKSGDDRDDHNARQKTSDYFRLFMVPGMSHCGLFGGPGPQVFDAVAALEQWVEHGIKPDTMLATAYVNGNPSQGVAMTRPLCPYPKIAKYRAGDPAQAASFKCVSDRDDYAQDLRQEEKNLDQNSRVGDPQNLPN
jgi:feruloyl esterase